MKKPIIRIAAAIAITAATLATPSYATDKNPKGKDAPDNQPTTAWARIEPYGNDKKVLITVHPLNAKRTASIRIVDADQQVIYQEYVKPAQPFSKVYDLHQLGEGTYTMEVINGRNETKKAFVLKEMLYTDALRVIFLASSDVQHFRFAMENLTRANVQMEVNDANGKNVYKQTLPTVFKKVVEKDFSFLKPGEYTVKVWNDKGEFSKKLLVP
jgi:hypothetical protein